MFLNKHGVVCVRSNTGRLVGVNTDDGFRNYQPIDVPVVCYGCVHFDPGKFTEGHLDRLSPPSCILQVIFPVKQGKCKKYETKVCREVKEIINLISGREF
jgi:hypothetical protein